MNFRALSNEFAKMRHLHVVALITVLFIVTVGIGLYAGVFNPDFQRSGPSAWAALLMGLGSGFSLASPLLLAVLASRLVDAEHQGGGWLLSATSGLTPGQICRAKFLALGILLTAVTIGSSLVFAAVGLASGIEAPWPGAHWTGLTGCLLVVNLSLLALHIVLAARVENQLVGIGIGLLGTILALLSTSVPAWLAHLTPWGYYALSAAAGYAGDHLEFVTPSYASVICFGIVAAGVFTIFTRAFDRQED